MMTATNRKTASFGITHYLGDENPQSMLDRADRALYRAKQQGRASWVQQDGRAPADQPRALPAGPGEAVFLPEARQRQFRRTCPP